MNGSLPIIRLGESQDELVAFFPVRTSTRPNALDLILESDAELSRFDPTPNVIGERLQKGLSFISWESRQSILKN